MADSTKTKQPPLLVVVALNCSRSDWIRVRRIGVLLIVCGAVLLHMTFSEYSYKAMNFYLKQRRDIVYRSVTHEVDDSLRLHLDYTNLERLSPFAKEYERVQNDCSINTLAIARTRQKTASGLGSDIHVYSVSMCKALEMKYARVRTVGSWIWTPEQYCPRIDNDNNTVTRSPMLCYFPQSEIICPNDDNDNDSIIARVDITDYENDGIVNPDICPYVTAEYGGTGEIRAATTEYLFTRLADFVIDEAERQLNVLFGNNTRTNNSVPKNLITVHIRWGDKKAEMKLLLLEHYINAVNEILQRRKAARTATAVTNVENEKEDLDEDVNIYLSTEDPKAVEQFMNHAPEHWNVYLDQYYVEMLKHRTKMGNVYNANTKIAKQLEGQSGVIALGSLLVAMEAKDYVLTTGSNWSRLMNEIRKNILNPRCNNCTHMIDLSAEVGEFRL